MKSHENQWLLHLLSPLICLGEPRTRVHTMVSGCRHLRRDVIGDDSREIWACKLLRTKYFYGVSLGNQHLYLLKSDTEKSVKMKGAVAKKAGFRSIGGVNKGMQSFIGRVGRS